MIREIRKMSATATASQPMDDFSAAKGDETEKPSFVSFRFYHIIALHYVMKGNKMVLPPGR
jgi:hypothetical protein